MISTILKSGETVRFALGYNEKKVDAGVAAVVGVRNIPDDDTYSIRSALAELEENIAISVKASHLAFHLSVSPGEDDSIEEETAIKYIDSIMVGMGYGEQPYAIYRHNDIDREHYHVVSVRAGRNGHIIDSRNERYRLMTLQKKYAEMMGFHPGLPPEKKGQKRNPAETKGGNGVLLQIRTAVEDIVRNCDWDNVLEVKLALKEKGIEMRRKSRDGKVATSFRYKDKEGNVVTRLYGAGKVFPDVRFEDMLEKQKTLNVKKRAEDGRVAARAAAVAKACIEKAESVMEFGYALSQVGFSAEFLDSRGRRTTEAENVAIVVMTDIENRSLTVLHEVERHAAVELKKKPFRRKDMNRTPLSRQEVERLMQELAALEENIGRKIKSFK